MEKTTGQLLALLDANVLYGNKISDILLWLAYMDVYIPRWTERIQNKWSDNLAKNRPDLTREKINKTREHMSRSFPEACVNGYSIGK